jgi:Tfp pilus assembly major pilin PilA
MYTNKYTPEEKLERIKLFMKYDSSKTLNENKSIIEQIDPSGDIRDIRDELGSVFNADEQSIVNILKKYTNMTDFNKLLSSYKEKYGKDLGDALGMTLSQYSDKKEWEDLKNHLATFGVELGSEIYNKGNNTRVTFKGGNVKTNQDTKTDINTKTDNTKTDQNIKTAVIPKELTDVKAFQDWLDKNHPGWHDKYKTLNSDVTKGYGKYGPRTTKAWIQYKDEYLKKPEVTPPPPVDAEEGGTEEVFGDDPKNILANN